MFTDDQIELLQAPILADNVESREGFNGQVLSYLTGHHAIAEANRIFGFDGWDTEILVLREVNRLEYIKPKYKSGDQEKPMVNISYICNLRVTVRSKTGVSVHEDTGFGDGSGGQTAHGFNGAIELASKEAVTDAIKRCLRHFGNQFGNTLYEKDGAKPVDSTSYEASKIVDETAIKSLYKLLEQRGLTEAWATAWLEGEGWTEPMGELRTDWYNLIYKAVDNYGKDIRDREAYESDMDNVVKLMGESVNMNMLKALFSEAWKKTGKYDDKDRQLEIQKLYETIKSDFEEIK